MHNKEPNASFQHKEPNASFQHRFALLQIKVKTTKTYKTFAWQFLSEKYARLDWATYPTDAMRPRTHAISCTVRARSVQQHTKHTQNAGIAVLIKYYHNVVVYYRMECYSETFTIY